MSRYVVAGVTGRVGSAVASELLAREHDVSVIVRDPARAGAWTARGAAVAVGSLGDAAFLRRALAGADGFFTLLPDTVDPADFHAERRRLADAVTEGVRDSGVPRVVLVSTIAAALAEGNGPARGLHYIETALRSTGSALTAVRACGFQENVLAVVPAARHAGIYPSFAPTPDTAAPMLAARDAGAIAARELEHDQRHCDVVDVVGPMYSAQDVAIALGDALGKRLEVVTIPPAEHVMALSHAGLPRQLAEIVAELHAAIAAGRVVPRGDRVLSATTTLDETLRAALAAADAMAVR